MPGVIHRQTDVDDAGQVVASGRTGASICLRNLGPGEVFLGNDSVTPEIGFPLRSGESVEIELEGRAELRAICASGNTADIRALAS